MKKKFVSIVLTALMVASLTTACGSKEAEAPAPAPAAEEAAEAPAPAQEEEEEAPEEVEEEAVEEEAEEEAAEDSGSEGFTLLDVTTDMIDAGVYATGEDGMELVFSLFTEPSGTQMASLFVFAASGEGDVICGPYTGATETDEDGITWSIMTVSDVYTGTDFSFGFGESGEEVYIFDLDGTPYEGQYLSADETIDYMGVAAALVEQ